MKSNNKGFTLIELVINLSLMTFVLLLVFKLLNINTVLTVDNNNKKTYRTEYLLVNTALYKDIQQSKEITITENEIVLDNTSYNVINKTLYKDSKELFKVKDHQFIKEDVIKIYIELDDQTNKSNEINLTVRRE